MTQAPKCNASSVRIKPNQAYIDIMVQRACLFWELAIVPELFTREHEDRVRMMYVKKTIDIMLTEVCTLVELEAADQHQSAEDDDVIINSEQIASDALPQVTCNSGKMSSTGHDVGTSMSSTQHQRVIFITYKTGKMPSPSHLPRIRMSQLFQIFHVEFVEKSVLKTSMTQISWQAFVATNVEGGTT